MVAAAAAAVSGRGGGDTFAAAVVAVGYNIVLAVRMSPVAVHTRHCSHCTAHIDHIHVGVGNHIVHTEDMVEDSDYTPRTVVVHHRRHRVRMLVHRE